MKEKKIHALYVELEDYENQGIRMKLENSPASPMQIVTAHMMKEESNFMRDYVWDEKGYVREVHFHDIVTS